MKRIDRTAERLSWEKRLRIGKRVLAIVMMPVMAFSVSGMNLAVAGFMTAHAEDVAVTTDAVSAPAPAEAPKEEPKADPKPAETKVADPAPETPAPAEVPSVYPVVPTSTEAPAPVLDPVSPASTDEQPAPSSTDPAVAPVVGVPAPSDSTASNIPDLTPAVDSAGTLPTTPTVEAAGEATTERILPIPEWVSDGNKQTTGSAVVLGKTYIAPQNDQVTVTFTKLPDNPGKLSIEEITLTDEQVASLHALSNKAYDITSDMADGTFTYTMTLPKPKDRQDVQIKFAEDIAGLDNADAVAKTDVTTKTDSVSAKLDHFTIFVVADPNVAANDATDALAGSFAWANPDYAKVSDDNYAVFTSPGTASPETSQYLKVTDFGLSVPLGATINGIEVTVERSTTSTSVKDSGVYLVKSGTIVGTNHALTSGTGFTSCSSPATGAGCWQNTEHTVTYGSPTDKWGAPGTWSPSDLNSATSGVVFSAVRSAGTNSKAINVDNIRMKVYYTVSSTTSVFSSVNPSNSGDPVTFTATVTGSGVTPTGTVTFKDESVTLGTGTLSGSGSSATATFLASALLGGSHSITAVYNADSLSGNYDSSTSAVLTQVVRIPLTIPTQSLTLSKPYDGNNNLAVTAGTLSGLIPGDTVTVSAVATYDTKNVGTGKTITVVYTLSGADADKYSKPVNYVVTTGEITTRAITVTASANSKAYDGGVTALAIPTATSVTQVAPGDTENFTEHYSVKTVGTGKTLIPVGSVSDGNSGNNYAVTFVNSLNGEITPSSLTVSGLSASDKTYDSTTDATLSGTGVLVGVISGDSVTLSGTAVGAFTNKNVGSGKNVLVSGLSLIGDDASGYTLTQPVLTATISQAPLSITAQTDSKVYDGGVTAGATPNVAGLVGSTDTVTGLAETYDTKDVGTGKTLSVSAYTVNDGNSGGNYAVTTHTNTTGIITKADATVTINPYTVTYDGNAHTATVASIVGVNGETDATVGTVSLNTTHTDAGTYNTDSWSFTGASNYNNIASTTITDTINKADATIIVNGYTGTYDGTPHGSTIGTATGVGGADLSGSVSLGSSFTDVTGGTAHWTFSNADYNDQSGDVNIIINKASSVTAISCPASVVYTSGAQTPCTVSVTGVGGLSLAPTPSYTANTDVGTANASYTYGGDGNHTGSSDSKDFGITPAIATVVVTPYSVTYDGDAHTATVVASGVGTDTDLSGSVDLSGTIRTNAGDYPEDAWSFVNANYISQSGTVHDHIEKAGADCSVISYDVTYDGLSHTATGTCTGVGGVEDALGGLDLSGTIHTDAGDYSGDAWTFTDVTGNYNNDSGTVDDTIGKADLTVTADNITNEYGDADPTFTFAYEGFVDGETASVIDTPPTCTVSVLHTEIGTYPIICSGGIDNNYAFGYVGGTLTVEDTTNPDEVKDLDATYRPLTKDVLLTWDAKDSDIEKVYIYRGATRHFTMDSGSRVAKQDKNDETYVDDNVIPGKTYYYKLVSHDSVGNESDAEVVKITIPVNGTVARGEVVGTEPAPASEGQPATTETPQPGSSTVEGTTGGTQPSGGTNGQGTVLGADTQTGGGFWGSIWMWIILIGLGGGAIAIFMRRRLNGNA
ncbi:MAG: YDG domain-containing protein [Candidatus Moraniibacteriota bacterium]